MNNENQGVDTINSTEEEVIVETEEVEESPEETETVEQEKTYTESELKQKISEANKQILARAKKAEAALKTKADANITKSTVSEADIEKKILLSQGMSQELLSEAEALAKVRGVSLLEVQTDPIFVEIKKSKEAQKARLPASKGSGSVKEKKTFNTPGLTPAERKTMWKEMQSQ